MPSFIDKLSNSAKNLSALAILLPLFVLNSLALWYFSPTPFYPDEMMHYALISHIDRYGGTPAVGDKIKKREKIFHMNFGYGNYKTADGGKGFAEDITKEVANGWKELDSPVEQMTEKAPTYYIVGAWFKKLVLGNSSDIFTELVTLRLYSLILWAFTVFAMAGIMREAFPENRLYQMLGLGLIGFNPRFTAAGVSVNSDMLGILIMTLLLWRMMVLIRSDSLKTFNTLLCFALSLIALMAEPQMVLAIPYMVLAVVIGHHRKFDKKKMAILLGTLFLLFIVEALAYHYFFRQTGAGKSIFDIGRRSIFDPEIIYFFYRTFSDIFIIPFISVIDKEQPFQVFFQYWAYALPGRAEGYAVIDQINLVVLKVFVWTGMIGMTLAVIKQKVTRIELFLITIAVSWWLWINLLTWIVSEAPYSFLQGRFFFPVIGATIPALIIGCFHFIKERREPFAKAGLLFIIFYFEFETIKTALLAFK